MVSSKTYSLKVPVLWSISIEGFFLIDLPCFLLSNTNWKKVQEKHTYIFHVDWKDSINRCEHVDTYFWFLLDNLCIIMCFLWIIREALLVLARQAASVTLSFCCRQLKVMKEDILVCCCMIIQKTRPWINEGAGGRLIGLFRAAAGWAKAGQDPLVVWQLGEPDCSQVSQVRRRWATPLICRHRSVLRGLDISGIQ